MKFNKPRVIEAAHGKALGKKVPGRRNREGKGAEARPQRVSVGVAGSQRSQARGLRAGDQDEGPDRILRTSEHLEGPGQERGLLLMHMLKVTLAATEEIKLGERPEPGVQGTGEQQGPCRRPAGGLGHTSRGLSR